MRGVPVLLVVTVALALCGCKTSQGQKIGLITTELNELYRLDVSLRLSETGRFESVTFLNESSLPSLEELVQNFDALLLWSGIAALEIDHEALTYMEMQPFPEPEVLGDLLQGFLEQGGGVVLAVAGFSGDYALKGTFSAHSSVILPQAAGTNVPVTASGGFGNKRLGEVFLPEHPTMHNITSFSTGGAALRTNMLPSQVESKMAEGSYVVAAYDDGVLLMAVRDEVGPNKTNRVDLNFHPVSYKTEGEDDTEGRAYGGWMRNTQGAELMANALFYSMSGCGSFAPQPLTIITCSEGMSVEGEEMEMAVPEFSNSPSLHVVGTCHGPITITQSPAAGTLLAVGLHNITVQVEDALGTLLQCTTTFTVTSQGNSDQSSESNASSASASSSTDTSEAARTASFSSWAAFFPL